MFSNEFGKFGGAGDIGPLTNIDKITFRPDGERLQATELCVWISFRNHTGRKVTDRIGNRSNMIRCSTTASACNIEKATFSKTTHQAFHHLGGLIITTELIGQSCVGENNQRHIGDLRKAFDIRPHFCRPKGTIDPHTKERCMGDRNPKGFNRLPGKGAST